MLENSRKELLNKEMSFVELDNYMMSQGFYNVALIEDIKVCHDVVYANKETHETEIKIDFEIIEDNAENEPIELFYLKINKLY